MGSVRTILASLFTALGGFFLLAMTAGVGFALYLATVPDSISAPSEADAIATTEPVKAEMSGVLRLASSLKVSVAQADAKVPASTSDGQTSPPRDERAADTPDAPSLLGRPWAPAEMLVPPKDVSADNAAEITASNDVPPTEDEPVSASTPTTYFEGGGPLPTVQTSDQAPVAAAPEPRKAEAPKPKKTKTARRRPAKYESVETTISNGFDSLQRSIASMF